MPAVTGLGRDPLLPSLFPWTVCSQCLRSSLLILFRDQSVLLSVRHHTKPDKKQQKHKTHRSPLSRLRFSPSLSDTDGGSCSVAPFCLLCVSSLSLCNSRPVSHLSDEAQSRGGSINVAGRPIVESDCWRIQGSGHRTATADVLESCVSASKSCWLTAYSYDGRHIPLIVDGCGKSATCIARGG